MTFTAPVITIDGPSGVGKGTVCRVLAEILRWQILDSGAIYRVLALIALNYQLNIINNEEMLVKLATSLDIRFNINHGKCYVTLKGKDVSQAIRNESISNMASQIAVLPRVRAILLEYQRTFRIPPGVIADGRDMGTIVFPDALVKIFLYASLKERVYRRMLQLQEEGFNVNFKSLLYKIKKRDDRDSNRIIAPSVPANDALILDSSKLTINEVVMKILAYARKVLML